MLKAGELRRKIISDNNRLFERLEEYVKKYLENPSEKEYFIVRGDINKTLHLLEKILSNLSTPLKVKIYNPTFSSSKIRVRNLKKSEIKEMTKRMEKSIKSKGFKPLDTFTDYRMANFCSISYSKLFSELEYKTVVLVNTFISDGVEYVKNYKVRIFF